MVIYGNLGEDDLTGGVGDDILFGGQNNDTLRGNDDVGATDTMQGGAGADRFIFNFGTVTDMVPTALPTTTVTRMTAASNLVIKDLTTADTLVFDAAGTSFNSESELEAIATVIDDGTDVTIKFESDTGSTAGTITVTLEGIGDGSIDSLAAVKIANRWLISRATLEEFAKTYVPKRGRPRTKRKYTKRSPIWNAR